MSDKKRPSDKSGNQEQPTFTVDVAAVEVATMPSITKLLNRKRLETTTTSLPAPEQSALKLELPPAEGSPGTQTQTQTHTSADCTATGQTATEQTVPQDQTAPIGQEHSPPPPLFRDEQPSGSRPIARHAKRRAPVQKLIIWQPNELKQGPDPLGKGLSILLDRGAMNALFLSIAPSGTGSTVPHFKASAAVLPQKKKEIWTGMKWDPTVAVEMWNQFIKVGYIEYAPPGTTTDMKSNRNIARAAFGITQDEWLLLVRIGPSHVCRGILAVVSKKSLIPVLSLALPHLTASVQMS
ncbi:MAG: hypothetical protein A2428_09045 [Bdellovibrionales bacterium RIFOXYC1_FULL_54_43]|nr:MAG: hypothetical protein A2428_09045 [Bdellovibrionales bacterium RIFOXYC1_FULL_54_43]OFZ80602.1 MAG: hypothetical protein A2603_06845 [Bdellovibrionales bacterium RIFOXYD1_FULL_55_31]